MLGVALKYMSVDEVTTYTINDRVNQPLLQAQSPFYYISVNNIDGHSQADISYESHPIPNATGEKSGDVFRRGKTITLSGFVTGNNFAYLEAGVDYLKEMFNETGQRKLKWTRLSDGVEVYYLCSVNQDLAIPENVESGNYRFSWVVGLRADSPLTRRTSNDSVYPTWQT